MSVSLEVQEKKLVLPLTPQFAVEDAMMLAQVRYVEAGLFKYRDFDQITLAELEGAINNASSGKCYKASDRVIKELAVPERRNLFTGGVILSGVSTIHSRHHGAFLVHGIDNMWYAGSPANNRTYAPRFSRLYSSDFLPDVLEDLRNDELGTWPDTDRLEKIFASSQSALPSEPHKKALIVFSRGVL